MPSTKYCTIDGLVGKANIMTNGSYGRRKWLITLEQAHLATHTNILIV